MTHKYPAPPNWPLFIVNRTEWWYFERAGCDMRMFELLKRL